MSAGPKYQYLWADGETIIRPEKCSANLYMERLMSWIEKKFDDEAIFPIGLGDKFGPMFQPTIRTIFKRLFRVYCHVYYSHFRDIESIGGDSYVNVSFKHFVYFIEQHDLVEEKELKPLSFLIDNIREKDREQHFEEAKKQPAHGRRVSWKPEINEPTREPARLNANETQVQGRRGHQAEASLMDERSLPLPIPPAQVQLRRHDKRKPKSILKQSTVLSEPPMPSPRAQQVRGSMYYSGQQLELQNGTWAVSEKGDVPVHDVKQLQNYKPRAAVIGMDFDAELMVMSLKAAGYSVDFVVADRTAAVVNQWADLHRIARVVGSVDAVLRDESVVVVAVCYNTLKLKHLRKLVATSGKFVIFSPMSVDLDVRDIVLSHGHPNSEMTTFVDVPMRFMPVNQRLHELINVDKICGQARHLQAHIQVNYRSEIEALFPDPADESVMDRRVAMKNLLLLYVVDLIHWLLNGDSIAQVNSCFKQVVDSDVDDLLSVTFKTAQGVMGAIHISLINAFSPAKFKLEISGSEGQVNVADNRIFFSNGRVDANNQRHLKLMMDDKSAETSADLPFQLVSSSKLHLLRALKLFIFDSTSQATLTPNQMNWMESVLLSRCDVNRCFENSCIVAAIDYQRSSLPSMMSVSDVLGFSESKTDLPQPPPRRTSSSTFQQ
jgi:predicted dehydrogenase